METLTFNDILSTVAALPEEDQDMLFEILRKRRGEAWRKELAAYGKKARRSLQAGTLKAEPAEKLVARLRAQWAADDAS